MTINYLVAISKPGFSARDHTNKQNFIFRSDLVSMAQKSVIHPTVTTVSVDLGQPGTSGQGASIIPHNFGYIPKFLAFFTGSDGIYRQVPGGRETLDLSFTLHRMESTNIEIDENYIYISMEAFDYTFDGFDFVAIAVEATYTLDVILFMERLGLGLTILTSTKAMSAKASIV